MSSRRKSSSMFYRTHVCGMLFVKQSFDKATTCAKRSPFLSLRVDSGIRREDDLGTRDECALYDGVHSVQIK